MTTDTKRGEVTAFDGQRGVANVRLDSGRTTEVPAGAFLSGRPARLPAAGDRVEVRMRADVPVLARLVR